MFQARFPGRCAVTGQPIKPGDTIRSAGRGRYALIERSEPVDHDAAYALSIDPDLDPVEAAEVGAYMRRSLESGVSHVWNSGGREYYRNRSGRCEDAPCCGCCNV